MWNCSEVRHLTSKQSSNGKNHNELLDLCGQRLFNSNLLNCNAISSSCCSCSSRLRLCISARMLSRAAHFSCWSSLGRRLPMGADALPLGMATFGGGFSGTDCRPSRPNGSNLPSKGAPNASKELAFVLSLPLVSSAASSSNVILNGSSYR